MKKSIFKYFAIALTLGLAFPVKAQDDQLAQKMAATVMAAWNDTASTAPSLTPKKWSYDLGVIYEGFEGIWKRTGDATYFKAMQKNMDSYLSNDGYIHNYKITDK